MSQMVSQNSSQINNSRQQPTAARRINIGSSAYWRNGENLAPLRLNKYGEMTNGYAEGRFNTVFWTILQIIAHLLTGRAITPARFNKHWRSAENFIDAQLIGVDCDEMVSVSELANVPFVVQYGVFVHATKRSTPEAPRSRVYFLLDEPITSASDYQRLTLRVIHQVSEQLGKKADIQCSDAARRFLGCANAEHIIYAENVLSLATLEILPQSPQEIQAAEDARQRAESRQSAPPVDAAYAQRLAYREINRKANILANTSKSNRNAEHRSAAFYAGTFVGAGAISEQDAFNIVNSAALAAGRPTKEAEQTTRGGLKKGALSPADIRPPTPRNNDKAQQTKRNVPVAAKTDNPVESTVQTPAPVPTATTFTPLINDTLEGIAVTHVNVRYVSELPLEMFLNRCVLLRAGLAQGKTSLAELLKPDRIACPRQSLVGDVGRRFDMPTSNTIPAAYQYQPDGFVYCLPSILNQIDARGNIRIPRCLVIDEIEQLILALFSSIISKRDRPRIFAALCICIQHAPTVLCLDADAGSLSHHFLTTLRSDVTFIVNDYRDTSRKMLKYENKSDIEKEIDAKVREDKGLNSIACTSDELAQDFGDTYSPVLGADRVLVITAKTKKTDPRVREFFEHPDHHAGKYALITYSSAMGTGVDISDTKPLNAFGVFGRGVLTAWDMHQAMMRFRHAETYHVWVDKTLVNLPTDAALIEAKHHEAEKFTRDAILFDEQGRNLVQLQREQMTALASQVAARRNSSLVNLRGHFFSLAVNRYTVSDAGTKASREEHEQIRASLDAARDARKAEDDALVLNPLTRLVDTPTYKRYASTGQLTIEIEAGHKKYNVQETYGQNVTPETLKDYGDKGEGRAQLLLLESLYQHEGESKAHDAEELRDGVYALDLTHATNRRKLLLEVMRPFMNEDRQFDTSAVIERSAIDEYMRTFLAEKAPGHTITNEYRIRLYFGWRYDYSSHPKNLLRFMLGQAGLKLERVRRRDGVQRYRIEPEILAKMERYIRQRKAALPKSVKESYSPIEFQVGV